MANRSTMGIRPQVASDVISGRKLAAGRFDAFYSVLHPPEVAALGEAGSVLQTDADMAAARDGGATQLVRDVHDFPGHIACDSASNSARRISAEHCFRLNAAHFTATASTLILAYCSALLRQVLHANAARAAVVRRVQ